MNDTRRTFLKHAGRLGALGLMEKESGAAAGGIALISPPGDALVASAPVKWAIEQLRAAAQQKNASLFAADSLSAASDAALLIRLATPVGLAPEGFTFAPERQSGKPGISVAASDARGFVYALLELADRVRFGSDAQTALAIQGREEEKPANRVRSIARAFVSDVEDKPWYYDKEFWREYLTTLASNRFNRFTLTFGLGYDFPRNVTGDYLHFAYPYLLNVPGYNVRPVPLQEGERERNLEMLKFISEETALRGMHFQLALWTHAYQWTDSPNAQHRIEGLTPETHGPYCRDAMALLLRTCPAVAGLTMRVHGESGIPEGSLNFWRDVFEGIVGSGREVEIDLHAKGLDQSMMDLALHTGMPVKISPKYWAEHMGLAYHQAAIRELEMPKADKEDTGIFKLSDGSRRFLRYGYGDLFQQGHRYDVMFRLWPGSQRLLLWGDPAIAAAYGRASHFCGASGVEICEPLFFKGRQGSGLPGGRCAYAVATLKPKYDFEKYLYTYRVWGRLLYNPDADPEGWRRFLRSGFRDGASAVEEAITSGSRVLPLFTTARLPSASNLGCWPEVYTNMPIVEGSAPSPYADTVVPKRLGTVSPLDPQLFSTVEEYTGELLGGQRSGKYSPVEVAQWLEDTSAAAMKGLASAAARVPSRGAPEFRRVEEDVLIEAGMGRFFAGQIRSAALFDIYRRTGDPVAGKEAVSAYRGARDAWAQMAARAGKVYREDITFGDAPVRRGHWMDRLGGIEKDLAAMEARVRTAPPSAGAAAAAIREALGRPKRVSVACSHAPAKAFRPAEGVRIGLTVPEQSGAGGVSSVRLYFRHVDQAERWEKQEMWREGGSYSAEIAASYTKSAFALEYYFELRRDPTVAWLYPAFDSNLAGQPYFLIRHET